MKPNRIVISYNTYDKARFKLFGVASSDIYHLVRDCVYVYDFDTLEFFNYALGVEDN